MRAINRLRAEVDAVQGIDPMTESEALAADAALALASRTELADELMEFGEHDPYGRMLCARGKVRQRSPPYTRALAACSEIPSEVNTAGGVRHRTTSPGIHGRVRPELSA